MVKVNNNKNNNNSRNFLVFGRWPQTKIPIILRMYHNDSHNTDRLCISCQLSCRTINSYNYFKHASLESRCRNRNLSKQKCDAGKEVKGAMTSSELHNSRSQKLLIFNDQKLYRHLYCFLRIRGNKKTAPTQSVWC